MKVFVPFFIKKCFWRWYCLGLFSVDLISLRWPQPGILKYSKSFQIKMWKEKRNCLKWIVTNNVKIMSPTSEIFYFQNPYWLGSHGWFHRNQVVKPFRMIPTLITNSYRITNTVLVIRTASKFLCQMATKFLATTYFEIQMNHNWL